MKANKNKVEKKKNYKENKKRNYLQPLGMALAVSLAAGSVFAVNTEAADSASKLVGVRAAVASQILTKDAQGNIMIVANPSGTPTVTPTVTPTATPAASGTSSSSETETSKETASSETQASDTTESKEASSEAETPTVTETPAAEETPAVTETPAAEEKPAVTEAPTAEVTPAATEESRADETPAVTETPAATETSGTTETSKADSSSDTTEDNSDTDKKTEASSETSQSESGDKAEKSEKSTSAKNQEKDQENTEKAVSEEKSAAKKENSAETSNAKAEKKATAQKEQVTGSDALESVKVNISSSSDVDTVVQAYKYYESLTDKEKSKLSQSQIIRLKSAQSAVKQFNSSSNGIYVNGDLPWYVQFRVEKIGQTGSTSSDLSQLLGSYEMTLWNLLEDCPYTLASGETVTVTVPVENAEDYENVTILHYLSDGSYEELEPEISDGTVSFVTRSFSPYSISGVSTRIAGSNLLVGSLDKVYKKSSGSTGSTSTNSTNSSKTSTSSGKSSTSNSSASYSSTLSSSSTNSSSSTSSTSKTASNKVAVAVKTGDTSGIVPYIVTAGVGAAAIIVLIIYGNLKKKHDEKNDF